MNSAILISLAISALIMAASIGLEYAIVKKRKFVDGGIVERDPLAKWGSPIMTIHPGDAQASYVSGAAQYLTERLERKRHCNYCKTVQGVGDHCLNCGAPLS